MSRSQSSLKLKTTHDDALLRLKSQEKVVMNWIKDFEGVNDSVMVQYHRNDLELIRKAIEVENTDYNKACAALAAVASDPASVPADYKEDEEEKVEIEDELQEVKEDDADSPPGGDNGANDHLLCPITPSADKDMY